MKKIVITATLLAMLGTFAVSCQKEADTVPATVYSRSEYNVLYRIDNILHHANIQSPEISHRYSMVCMFLRWNQKAKQMQ